MDWYWWALIGVGVLAWYIIVGRWIARDLRKEKRKPSELYYVIWILSPMFAVVILGWYSGWLLSGGLIPSPHQTVNEDQ